MSTKNTRSGGKYGGNHTTLIDAAILVCDVADECVYVTKICPGFIRPGLRPANGNRRVKISDCEGGILLTVRDNTSLEEIRVYASDVQAAKLAIACGARNRGLRVVFGKAS